MNNFSATFCFHFLCPDFRRYFKPLWSVLGFLKIPALFLTFQIFMVNTLSESTYI